MFAGQAEITRMFRYASMPAARLDLSYMEAQPGRMNPMDLLTDAGMANLCQSYIQDVLFIFLVLPCFPYLQYTHALMVKHDYP